MIPSPVQMATDLRCRVANEALLDPFGWLGIGVVAQVAYREDEPRNR
jgi:hypothetical protein